MQTPPSNPKRKNRKPLRSLNKSVTLLAECDVLSIPAFNPPQTVIIVRENDEAWFGWPMHNPESPILEYPKYAWKPVRQEWLT